MKLFNKITIVGVGLLGGSLGLAIKKRGLAHRVVGFFRHKNKIADAVALGAIDCGTDDFKKAVAESDFIILCSPVSDIMDKLGVLKKLGLRETLITDIGSTKEQIVRAANNLNFVGSHPLAGSEQGGIGFARGELFFGSLCVLTPAANTPKSSVARVASFWRNIGCSIIQLKPQTHDRILAFTSHLPHAAAFSLINTIPQEMLKLSAGGLKDTTRIALSNPNLWLDIFLSNRKGCLAAISAFEKSLKSFKKALSQRDEQKLLSFLKASGNKRRGMPQKL